MSPSISAVLTPEQLAQMAKRLRLHVLKMTNLGKSSHVGSSFSMIEILAVLYGRILRVRPDEPDWNERDRFILSKGHACAGLYAVLAETGFFPREWLDQFYVDGGKLAGHVTKSGVPGIELSTGALGHGLSVACGMALAAQRDGMPNRVFTLLSDGECDEGSIWEAVLFAPHHKLDNLVAIVDYNQIQSLGRVEQVLDLHPLAAKWESFGWAIRELDGHDINGLLAAFETLPLHRGKPTCIIARTVKGKGVSFMEDQLLWHYRTPAGDEYERALRELEGR